MLRGDDVIIGAGSERRGAPGDGGLESSWLGAGEHQLGRGDAPVAACVAIDVRIGEDLTTAATMVHDWSIGVTSGHVTPAPVPLTTGMPEGRRLALVFFACSARRFSIATAAVHLGVGLDPPEEDMRAFHWCRRGTGDAAEPCRAAAEEAARAATARLESWNQVMTEATSDADRLWIVDAAAPTKLGLAQLMDDNALRSSSWGAQVVGARALQAKAGSLRAEIRYGSGKTECWMSIFTALELLGVSMTVAFRALDATALHSDPQSSGGTSGQDRVYRAEEHGIPRYAAWSLQRFEEPAHAPARTGGGIKRDFDEAEQQALYTLGKDGSFEEFAAKLREFGKKPRLTRVVPSFSVYPTWRCAKGRVQEVGSARASIPVTATRGHFWPWMADAAHRPAAIAGTGNDSSGDAAEAALGAPAPAGEDAGESPIPQIGAAAPQEAALRDEGARAAVAAAAEGSANRRSTKFPGMAKALSNEQLVLVKWRLEHGETAQGRPFYDDPSFAKWCEAAKAAKSQAKAGQGMPEFTPEAVADMHAGFVNAQDGAEAELEAWGRFCNMLAETEKIRGAINAPLRDSGERAVHRAAETGRLQNLAWLLQNGADVNATTAPAFELAEDRDAAPAFRYEHRLGRIQFKKKCDCSPLSFFPCRMRVSDQGRRLQSSPWPLASSKSVRL
ncbi:unnamed protein product [Prorocentrum cordatum]|uniref:Uncharacterized protein n=1 Tax=Prorocentrum cordatum TaxID=2364126 RepID=A0ABN9PXK7_9DINO|nr:unnamed protein product [Polarella glacialis]